jgi:hypothetical protein
MPKSRRKRPQVAAKRDGGTSRQDGREQRQQGRQAERQQDETGPPQCDRRRQRPAHDERGHRRGRGQGAAQVVEHLPQADERHAAVAAAMFRRADVAPAEYPGQQLPVAAHPAVLAQRRDVVARRKVLDDFDVGGEAGAREDAFEEVMAQQRALRHAARERGFEGIDVIDALAGERTFA